MRRSLMPLVLATLPSPARAEFFHYADILVGDRAMGLGGAFTATADDASAVHYNPAGLVRGAAVGLTGVVNSVGTGATFAGCFVDGTLNPGLADSSSGDAQGLAAVESLHADRIFTAQGRVFDRVSGPWYRDAGQPPRLVGVP